MFIQTWLLPFMLLLVATVVAFPLWPLHGVDHGRKVPADGGLRLVREAP